MFFFDGLFGIVEGLGGFLGRFRCRVWTFFLWGFLYGGNFVLRFFCYCFYFTIRLNS
jgi:hypothetical protein